MSLTATSCVSERTDSEKHQGAKAERGENVVVSLCLTPGHLVCLGPCLSRAMCDYDTPTVLKRMKTKKPERIT